MTEDSPLRPATPQEIVETLSFALRYDGRKRSHSADQYMAQITAERLVEQLRQAGFVILKKPPVAMHSSAAYQPKLKE
jgi:hypothetical protein